MSEPKDGTHEVGIIGTGPAGLAAGQYAGLNGIVPLIFEKESIGGELVNRDEIRGYPGFPDGVPGTELRQKLVSALERYEGEIILDEVAEITTGTPHTIVTSNGDYRCKNVVIATGGRPQALGVPGEAEYEGKGIFHCAKCDGPLYTGEKIVVVGGENHAIIDAIFLADWASEVTVVSASPTLSAHDHLIEEAVSSPNLTLRTNTEIRSIDGDDDVLESITIADTRDGTEQRMSIGGLYVHIGVSPNTGFVEGTVPLNADGWIQVTSDMETDVDRVYAVGDVREGSPQEVASAIGDGICAINAIANR